MFDTVLGLPVHVLVVHAVVVGLPLMALVTAAVAFMPTLRLRLAWPVAVADAGVVLLTLVARRERRAAATAARRAGRPGARRPRAEPDLVRAAGVRRRRGGGPDPRLPPSRPLDRDRGGQRGGRRARDLVDRAGRPQRCPGRLAGHRPEHQQVAGQSSGWGDGARSSRRRDSSRERPAGAGPPASTQASSAHSGSSWRAPAGALAGARLEVGEGVDDPGRVHVGQPEAAHPRGVDDPALAPGQPQGDGRGRRVPAAAGDRVDHPGRPAGARHERVDQRGLADPGVPDEARSPGRPAAAHGSSPCRAPAPSAW